MRLLATVLISAFFTVSVAGAAETGENLPRPYTAVYSVSYRGLYAGKLHFELSSGETGMYVYESHPDPSFLASLIVSGKAEERSVMQIDKEGVQPLYWFVDDGKSGHEHDGVLEFDWDKERVSGEVSEKRVDLPAKPGLQDRLSFQIEVMTILLRGCDPDFIPMISRSKIKSYSYTRAGTETITTEAGEFETILYESTSQGSKRLARIWHAPSLGYIPVRAEQLNRGKVETVMELVKVSRKGD